MAMHVQGHRFATPRKHQFLGILTNAVTVKVTRQKAITIRKKV